MRIRKNLSIYTRMYCPSVPLVHFTREIRTVKYAQLRKTSTPSNQPCSNNGCLENLIESPRHQKKMSNAIVP